MSVLMIAHFPKGKEGVERALTLQCYDRIQLDDHVEFLGLLVDMDQRFPGDKTIPQKALIKTEEVDEKYTLEFDAADLSESVISIPNGNFFMCRAAEFLKLPDNIDTTRKNLAFVSYMKALDPKTWVIIEVSW